MKQTNELEKIVLLDPNSLEFYDKNGKNHPPEQIEDIATQISKFGFDQPIVINEKNVILKGEGRTLASKKLKLKKVPCIRRTGLSQAEQIAIRAGDNRVAESTWNYDNLKFDFEKLKKLNFDLSFTGFKTPEIDTILSGWKTDLAKVDDIEAHTDGIFSVIKITCSPEVKDEVRTFIGDALSKSPFSGIKVG
jgi:ParB-like chromosome segregation protein Spo0J